MSREAQYRHFFSSMGQLSHLSLATEPREPIGIVRDGRQQHFDRDVAIQLRIPRAIHLAHSTGAKRRDDLT